MKLSWRFKFCLTRKKEGRKDGDNCLTIVYWLNHSASVQWNTIQSLRTLGFIFINTKECQWYMKWKKANNQTAHESVLFLKQHVMYMPTLPYKESTWKEMPQNVNTGCQLGGGGYRKYMSVFLTLVCTTFITRKRQQKPLLFSKGE